MDNANKTSRPKPIATPVFVGLSMTEGCAMCETINSSKWHRAERTNVLVCRVCANTGAFEDRYGEAVLAVPAKNGRPL